MPGTRSAQREPHGRVTLLCKIDEANDEKQLISRLLRANRVHAWSTRKFKGQTEIKVSLEALPAARSTPGLHWVGWAARRTELSKPRGALMTGAFGKLAYAACDLGLAPVPVGGPDGKRPLIKGYHRAIVTLGNVEKLQAKFGDENIALLCDASDLAVVDIDDAGLLDAMRRRFGDTPLICQTASRGWHLYYRSHPLAKPTDLRSSDGIDVEVKASRNIVLIPPSVSPVTGRQYEFVEGALDQTTLAQLPEFRAEALHAGRSKAERVVIEKGRRNEWLFRQCLRSAPACDDFDALLDVAITRNDECAPPMTEAEVREVARSAWNYEVQGKNWVGSSGRVVLSKELVHERARLYPGNPFVLEMKLRIEHSARVQRGEAFRLCRRSMAACQTLPGWTESNYRSAIDSLRANGLLRVVRSKPRQPIEFSFGSPQSQAAIHPSTTGGPV